MKNRRNRFMKRFITILGAGILALLAAACDTALGSMINIKGPVVTITGPALMTGFTDIAVTELFELKGSASSENNIVRMEVKMSRYDSGSKQTLPVGREWRYEGDWQYREHSGEAWKTYTPDIYAGSIDPGDPKADPAWNVSGKTVHWNFPLLLTKLETGEYFVTVNAWDAAGYHDSNSTQKIKVIYDDGMPNFKVRSPVLLFNNDPDSPNDPDNPDTPIQFSEYIYDPVNDPVGTYDYIHYWVNRSLDFSWDIQKEMIPGEDGLPYSLSFEFTNKHDLENPSAKQLYYRYEWPEHSVNPPAYGIFTDGTPGGYTRVGSAIKGDEIVRRDEDGNPLAADSALPNDEYTPIQVISTLKGAGNLEDKSNGWFAFLPDSDKPWADIKFGKKADPKEPIPDNMPDLAYIWTGNTYSANDAYDNDGVASLHWKLIKLENTGLKPDLSYTPREGDITFPNQREKESWNFVANPEYGIGRFKIEVTVKDKQKNGLVGDTYVSYFTIESNSTPTVREAKLYTPDMTPIADGMTLFGDSTGNFVIRGFAQIEDEGYKDRGEPTVKVDRVTIVWIKPGADWRDSQLLYQDRNYKNWDYGKDKPGLAGYSPDEKGNRVWELPAPVFTPGTGENDTNANRQYDWLFTKELNIFNDLDVGPDEGEGAGKNPSGAHTFLIRVLSRASDPPRSTVSGTITSIGDIKPPELTITNLILTKYNAAKESYEEPVSYSPSAMLPTIQAGDKLKVQGTWTDDSFTAWNGKPAKDRLDFFEEFKVTWDAGKEGLIKDFPGSVLKADNNELGLSGVAPDHPVWETGELEFLEKNETPIVYLRAGLSDLNNTTGITEKTLTVETDSPTLIRITTETSDGIYGDNKDTRPPNAMGIAHYMDIVLEFNKSVYFFDTKAQDYSSFNPPYPQAAPYLELNNGGRAVYLDGNGDNKLKFRYFVNGKAEYPDYPNISRPANQAVPGGTSTYSDGPGSPLGNLNVTGIIWPDISYYSSLKGIDSDDQVVIPSSVFDPADSLSLARGNNIVIDKEKPEITSVMTIAAEQRYHGAGSPIYIKVNFNKAITVTGSPAYPSRGEPGNFYLDLKGGNLAVKAAKALFDEAGVSSVTFRYDVLLGDDTSTFPQSQHLEIAAVVMKEGLSVTDRAGNSFELSSIPPEKLTLTKNLVIDTTPPASPAIAGIEAKNYYTTQTFNITGIESDKAVVQYTLNYDKDNPESTDIVWVTVDKKIESAEGGTGWVINKLPLNLNGEYRIAARQYDNATNPNRSAAGQCVGTAERPVKIDTSAILTRLGSSTPDGIYGYRQEGQEIFIDLIFRIPVYMHGGGLFESTYLELNVTNKDSQTRKAVLQALPAPGNNRNWTFTYTVEEGDMADILDVEELFLNHSFYDDPTGGTNLNEWIERDWAAIKEANNLAKQKRITILSGYPEVINKTVSITPDSSTPATGAGIRFYRQGDGNLLDIEFDRDIYRGDTRLPLIIKQIKGLEPQAPSSSGYRIPTVLSEREWSALFISRTDLAANTALMPEGDFWGTTPEARTEAWRELGEAYYRKGTNGANPNAGTTLLEPDTSVKYVLGYEIDPLSDDSGSPKTVGDIKNILREAEALRFDARDKEVTIENNSGGQPRILRINLTGEKALPVKGAKYQWTIPNGFIKDFLGKPNGGGTDIDAASLTGYDSVLTSGDPENNGDDNGNVLVRGLTAKPVIRIKKGEDKDDIKGAITEINRQAHQPLLSEARIDCRTPGTSLQYETRQTTDNVGRLIMRATPDRIAKDNRGNFSENHALPNLGSQIQSDNATFNAAKLRPQSGDSTDTARYAPGLNLWVPMNSVYGNVEPYSAPFSIGIDNYNAGGMEVNIHASVIGVTGSDGDAYEAAYRSVFVFNNAALNSNRVLDIGRIGGEGSIEARLPVMQLGRMWIRGGDSASGDTSVPDFPISRDRTLWRKARLMTPVSRDVFRSGNNELTEAGATNASFNNTSPHIPATSATSYESNGQYIWIWVTWRINIQYTYIDPFCGQLPRAGIDPDPEYDTPRYIKDLFQAYVPFKEHYPLIRGRTTVIEPRAPRNANGQLYHLIDGGNGELRFGAVEATPGRLD